MPQPALLSLGEADLDTIFGGGIAKGALLMLTGSPGAGKTILAQQISFAAVRDGLKVVYFTNVSEPHDKLVVHMRTFSFFDPSRLGRQVQMYNITSQVSKGSLSDALGYVVAVVRQEKADLVVIDSFRGLKHMLGADSDARRAIFELGAQLTLLRTTCLLVGEYTPHEIQTDPEFAIADGIVQLWHAHTGVQERRALRIIKLRGVSYLGGEHTFQINSDGIRVFPRQEALTQAPIYKASDERVSMGIPSLDSMMSGGPIRSSSTLIAGAAGVGKTLLALHFLAAGGQRNERGLMISFQENAEQLRMRASQFGLAHSLEVEQGQTEMLTLSPVELDVDMAAARIRDAVERRGVRRVVIDSTAEMELAVHDSERFDDYLASLIGYLRGREVTTVMTREITQLFGNELTIASRGLSYIVDNIVLIRYVELHSTLHRIITVLKSRGSNHDKRLRELQIDDGGIEITEGFAGYGRLMTGMPDLLGE
jgi:circadian clock protein KaiC